MPVYTAQNIMPFTGTGKEVLKVPEIVYASKTGNYPQFPFFEHPGLTGNLCYDYRTFILMTDEYYMMLALKEAKKAYEDDEVPVGAIIVMKDRIIARGHNMVERLKDPTAHAEMIALTSAFNLLGSKYLPEVTLYVTVEPCLMCAGAIYWSKLGKIVYGADDEKNGYKRTTGATWPFHPKTELVRGVSKEECGRLMKEFFQNKR